jgi:flagellar biosynthesis/type III secretory pathway ATPase
MSTTERIDIGPYLADLAQADLFRWRGTVKDVTGFVIESQGPASRIGSFCEIHTASG